MSVGRARVVGPVWGWEGQLMGIVLPSLHVGLGNWTQLVRHGVCSLSHLGWPVFKARKENMTPRSQKF